MKKIFALTAIAAALFAGSASATLYTIDDFSVSQGPVTDNTADLTPVVSTISQRIISVDQTLNPGSSSFTSSAEAVIGLFTVANASGTNSNIILTWALAAGTLPSASTAASFFLDVIASDGNPTNLAFFFNSSLLATFAIPGNTANQSLNFNLTPAQIALVSAGGTLELKMSGATGWDSTIDFIGFNDTPPNSHPAPEATTLALMGMGLAGFSAFRKRKQA